jgi:hypothetical protein
MDGHGGFQFVQKGAPPVTEGLRAAR